MLSGSLLTFLLINVFLYFGLYRIRETVETKNEELEEETAEYTEQLVEAQIKKRMGEITRLRAQYVDGGLTATAADVKYIADVMNALRATFNSPAIRFPMPYMPTFLPAGLLFITVRILPGRAFRRFYSVRSG